MCTVNNFSLTSLRSCVYSQQVFLDKFTFSCIQSTSFLDKFTFLCVQSTSGCINLGISRGGGVLTLEFPGERCINFKFPGEGIH